MGLRGFPSLVAHHRTCPQTAVIRFDPSFLGGEMVGSITSKSSTIIVQQWRSNYYAAD
uniref:Uncharacterized protein n=1 Tax=Arundo donax TaxID=35708 RepID=A0A0A9ER14_ARUDO